MRKGMRGALTAAVAIIMFSFAGSALASGAGGMPTPPKADTSSCQGNVCCDAVISIAKGNPMETYTLPSTYTQCQKISASLNAHTTAEQLVWCAKSKASGAGGFYSVAGHYSYADQDSVHTGNRCDQHNDTSVPVMTTIFTSVSPSDLAQQIQNSPPMGTGDIIDNPPPAAPSSVSPTVDRTTPLPQLDLLGEAPSEPASPVTDSQNPNTVSSIDPRSAYIGQPVPGDLGGASPARPFAPGTDVGLIDLTQGANPIPDANTPNTGEGSIGGKGDTSLALTPDPTANGNSNNPSGQCGLPPDSFAGYLAHAESMCGQHPQTYTRCGGTGACGALQYLPGTYDTYSQQYAQATGDTSCVGTTAIDTNCSVKIADWKMNQLAPTIQPLCQASGVAISNQACGYSCWWLGENGCQQLLKALPTIDPNASVYSLCGSTISQSACDSNRGLISYNGQPLSVAGMFQNMDRVMGVNGSVIPAMAAGGIPQTPFVPTPADYTSLGPKTTTAVVGNGSSLFGSSYSPLTGLLGTSLMSPFSSLLNSIRANAVQQQTVPPPAPPPTLSLTVQPQALPRGQSISVSWTTSSMSTGAPCTVAQNGTTIATANAGATSIPTDASTATTSAFRLLCQGASNGQIFQQTATAVLQ